METLEFPDVHLRLDSETLPPALGNCLICGQGNACGMRLRFHRLTRPDGVAVGVGAEATAPAQLEGFDGLLHGGAICALLDDAMWWSVYTLHGAMTVTADMQLRYRQPIATGAVLRLEGIAGKGRRIYPAASRVLDASGRVLAEATGRFVILPGDRADLLRL